LSHAVRVWLASGEPLVTTSGLSLASALERMVETMRAAAQAGRVALLRRDGATLLLAVRGEDGAWCSIAPTP
jgi:hypothetical protein